MPRIRSKGKNVAYILPTGGQVAFRNHIAEVSDPATIRQILQGGDYALELEITRPIAEAKSILIIRGSGLGDVLLMTPILRHIKTIVNPTAELSYMAGQYKGLLDGNPYIDNVFDLSELPMDMVTRFDYQAKTTMCEFERDSNVLHRVDVFARTVEGLEIPLLDKHLDYYVKERERAWAEKVLPRTGQKTALMVLSATASNRMFMAEKLKAIANGLIVLGWKVILADNLSKGWEADGVLNLCRKTGIREVAALVDRCDVLISPDTGTYHIGAALDKPIVVYFGAIDYRLRLTHEKNIVLVAESADCYPCHRYDCHSPKCLRDIPAERVVAATEEAWGRWCKT